MMYFNGKIIGIYIVRDYNRYYNGITNVLQWYYNPVWGQSGVSLLVSGVSWGRSGVSWGSVWGLLGVGLGSLGGRSGVPWGSVWGPLGVGLGSLVGRSTPMVGSVNTKVPYKGPV